MTRPADFEAALEAALSHLLSGQPVEGAGLAAGFSGGGDSTALLYGLRKFAANIHIFIVDHNLREGSAAEAKAACARAADWGYRADILTWSTQPLSSGVQAKARRARYGLIGAAMRERGLEYLLTGHTEDDQAETCLMRYERATDWRGAAGISPRVYAPVWPELAGISVLRPLLAQSRMVLRRYNNQCGLIWTEDPSNENRDFARIRARDYLQTHPHHRRLCLDTAQDMQAGRCRENADLSKWFEQYAAFSPHGFASITTVPPRQALLHLIRAISGQGGMVDPAALRRLQTAMVQPTFKAATLGGVQFIKTETTWLCVREPAIAKGRRGKTLGIMPQLLGAGCHLWDGRFEIRNKTAEDIQIMSAWGHIDVAMAKFKALKSIPHEARPTTPLLRSAQGALLSVGAVTTSDIEVRALHERRIMRSLESNAVFIA